MSGKSALITGIEGQDGSYLAEHLLELGYQVYGTMRPGGSATNIRHLLDRITLRSIDISDVKILGDLVIELGPLEIYHLAGPSFVGDSDVDAASKLQAIVTSTYALLEAAANSDLPPRVFFAGSSEMFGDPEETPQTEATPFRPRSAYGLSKVCGHEVVSYFRRTRSVWCCTGFLFNHESPRRPPRFVTKKITRAAARMSRGDQQPLTLGDLSARRDWGFAPDYVKAMVAMLQGEEPRDYVVATGKTHSVRDLIDIAFSHAGITADGLVGSAPSLVRPEPRHQLVGDPTAIERDLGWRAQTSFETMIRDMVDFDLANADKTREQ